MYISRVLQGKRVFIFYTISERKKEKKGNLFRQIDKLFPRPLERK